MNSFLQDTAVTYSSSTAACSTLQFVESARQIVNMAVVNEDPRERVIRELRAEIARLSEKCSELQPTPKTRATC